jgi:LysW-gamma-L-lysine carboxypeptidase
MLETTTEHRTRVTAAEAEALLQALVEISSLSGAEGPASTFLAKWLADHGFQSRVDETGSAIGERGAGPREIVLLGHIDTFPGEIPVRVEGRRLFGRGSVDAKGPLAAFAVAAALAEPPPDVRLVVIGASQEEAASSLGARHAIGRYRPAACLIGEPSGWDRITLGYKGRLNLAWSWTGGLAHSAGPTLSPAEVAVGAWRWLEDYSMAFNQDRPDEFHRLRPSLLSIQTTREGAYGRASIEVNFRLPPGLDPSTLEQTLRSGLPGGEMSFSGHESAFQTPNDSRLTRALRAAIRVEGGQPRHVHKTGTSDMNVVGPSWRCPIAAYGPGDSHLDHTPEEHIHLDEYQRSIRILSGALESLMRDPSPQHSQLS